MVEILHYLLLLTFMIVEFYICYNGGFDFLDNDIQEEHNDEQK